MTSSPKPLLQDKAVIVSGAASGMGAVCAELARAQGASVVAVDLDEAGLAALSECIDVPYEVCDLSEADRIAPLVEKCADRLGGLDGLVNAAGIYQARPILEITPEELDRMLAVNVRGLFFMQQAAARHMSRREGGSIVNFSSTAARVPRPVSSHYAASKAAVVSLTRSAAAALGGIGVRVNAVVPGQIETPMLEQVRQEWARLFDTTPEAIDTSWREQHPMGRLGTPAEVAEVVAFLLSDASSFVSGETVGVTGGTDDL
jgi:NAD(P)-dependent dehydrogenase (short-subunit alcohol dehydrogenase family)